MADYSNRAVGYLDAQLDSSKTSGTFTITVISVNGSPITWPTSAHRIAVQYRSTSGLEEKYEIIKITSASQSGSTATLTIGTRDLSDTDHTTEATQSSPVTFPQGSKVFIPWDQHAAGNTMLINAVNTVTGSGAIRGDSTTVPIVRLNNVTTSQRTAMTPANGDMVYDTTLGQFYKYEAGAWAAVATGTFSNAADTVAGKVDIATAAEISAGTATDATSGAINVIPVSQTVKTSSGAGDANKLPVLGAAGTLALGFLSGVTPIGAMLQWLTDTAPTGWLLCYGQAVSRTTYASLFSVISTVFGVGDGSTTFNLPDLRGRFPLGQDDMGGSSANRVTDTDADTIGGADGSETKDISHTHTVSGSFTGSDNGAARYLLTSLTSSTSGSATQNVMNPFITVNYIIFANA